MKIDKEPFQKGQNVIWRQGEEMGETMTIGVIEEVIGKPFIGTLKCKFGNKFHTFNKKDGTSIKGLGHIRLMKEV